MYARSAHLLRLVIEARSTRSCTLEVDILVFSFQICYGAGGPGAYTQDGLDRIDSGRAIEEKRPRGLGRPGGRKRRS